MTALPGPKNFLEDPFRRRTHRATRRKSFGCVRRSQRSLAGQNEARSMQTSALLDCALIESFPQPRGIARGARVRPGVNRRERFPARSSPRRLCQNPAPPIARLELSLGCAFCAGSFSLRATKRPIELRAMIGGLAHVVSLAGVGAGDALRDFIEEAVRTDEVPRSTARTSLPDGGDASND